MAKPRESRSRARPNATGHKERKASIFYHAYLIPKVPGTKIDPAHLPLPRDNPMLKDILNDKETMEGLVTFFRVEEWSDDLIKERYERFKTARENGTGCNYTILLRTTNQIVGSCGFKNIDRERKRAEFGIILHRSAWGIAAAESVDLSLSYAFDGLCLHEVYFETDEINVRAKNFCLRRGIPFVGKTSENYLQYSLTSEIWPSVKDKLAIHNLRR